MKSLLRSSFLGALLATALTLPSFAADKGPGFVDFGRFTPPSDGGQFVEVNITSGILAIAARLTEKQDADVADLIRRLKSIRVNVIGLDDGNRAHLVDRIQRLRSDLDEGGWERLVTVQEKQQDVGVYVKHRDGAIIEGVVVTVIEGSKEAVLVNVIGDIDPEKIALIGEKLNLPPLKKLTHAFGKS